MGFLGVTCYNSLQYLALTTTSPINTSLIASSGPVFSLLLGVLLFGERVSGGQVAGAAISLLGVAWVMVHGEPSRLASIDLERGDLYMLLATMCWALYTWLVRRKRPDMPMGVLLFVQICFGLIAAVPPLLYESATSSIVVNVDWHLVAVVAYISLMASLVAYFCWDKGVAPRGRAVADVLSESVAGIRGPDCDAHHRRISLMPSMWWACCSSWLASCSPAVLPRSQDGPSRLQPSPGCRALDVAESCDSCRSGKISGSRDCHSQDARQHPRR